MPAKKDARCTCWAWSPMAESIRSRRHLYALLRAAEQHNVQRVFVHAFLDGRDTAAHQRRIATWKSYRQKIRMNYGVGKIASVGGRYFAMDRDRRWERSSSRPLTRWSKVQRRGWCVCRSHRG
jgi:hypothetical protein